MFHASVGRVFGGKFDPGTNAVGKFVGRRCVLQIEVLFPLVWATKFVQIKFASEPGVKETQSFVTMRIEEAALLVVVATTAVVAAGCATPRPENKTSIAAGKIVIRTSMIMGRYRTLEKCFKRELLALESGGLERAHLSFLQGGVSSGHDNYLL